MPPRPTTVDGALVEMHPRVLDVRATAPGDLVFIGAEDTEMGVLITELDGCAFSHVGVIVDPVAGTMLSARTDRTGDLERPDLGGVRLNALADLAGRGLYVARLALPADIRAAGLALLASWEEDPSDAGDPASHSRFSFVKLIAVSTALASVRRRAPLPRRRAERLWRASHDVAGALRSTGPQPGFFCAEVVAEAFSLDYSCDDLWVRDGEPHPRGVVHLAAPPARPARRPRVGAWRRVQATVALLRTPEAVARLALALRQIGLDRRQVRATVRLAATLGWTDDDLFWRLFASARELRSGSGRLRVPTTVPRHRPAPFVPPTFLGDAALPRALVTPRMLLSSTVVSSVHRLVVAPTGGPSRAT